MGGGINMSLSRRAFTTGLALTPLAKSRIQDEHQGHKDGARSAGKTAEWQPKVFDDHQLSTVAILSELIIPKTDTPGAREAFVHQHLDDILSESPESARNRFLEGLWWLDGYCLRSSAQPFKDMAAEKQMQILLALYDASDPDLQPGRVFVHAMKTWTAKIYYSTEIGQQELNKGGRVPAKYVRACST
jgi:hypothetical protein